MAKTQLSIKEFVRETIREIEEALPKGYEIDQAIEFEISVTTTKGKDGGLNIEVLSGKLTEENEVVHTLNFAIINSVQKEEELKKASENFFKHFGRGIKQLSKETD